MASQRSHALLLQGPGDLGQFALARAMAKAYLCEQPTAGRLACGQCDACHLVDVHTHPDLFFAIPETLTQELGWNATQEEGEGGSEKRKPSKEVRVEAIRQAIAFAQQTSSRGQAKVMVVFPAERLNAISATALLKTLEEPPGQARFILGTMDAARLLPTLRSRCQTHTLMWPATAVAMAWLKDRGLEQPEVLLQAAGGMPLEALALAQAGIKAKDWLQLPQAVINGQGAVLEAWPLPLLIQSLQKLCTDAMRQLAQAPQGQFFKGPLPLKTNLQTLAAWSQRLNLAMRHAEHAWNPGLASSALLLEARNALNAL